MAQLTKYLDYTGLQKFWDKIKTYVAAKSVNVYTYKGSVADLENLGKIDATNFVGGEVYNVTSTGGNYAWVIGDNPTTTSVESGYWDELGLGVEINGKEDKTNKITSITSDTTNDNTNYSSVGAIRDYVSKNSLSSSNAGSNITITTGTDGIPKINSSNSSLQPIAHGVIDMIDRNNDIYVNMPIIRPFENETGYANIDIITFTKFGFADTNTTTNTFIINENSFQIIYTPIVSNLLYFKRTYATNDYVYFNSKEIEENINCEIIYGATDSNSIKEQKYDIKINCTLGIYDYKNNKVLDITEKLNQSTFTFNSTHTGSTTETDNNTGDFYISPSYIDISNLTKGQEYFIKLTINLTADCINYEIFDTDSNTQKPNNLFHVYIDNAEQFRCIHGITDSYLQKETNYTNDGIKSYISMYYFKKNFNIGDDENLIIKGTNYETINSTTLSSANLFSISIPIGDSEYSSELINTYMSIPSTSTINTIQYYETLIGNSSDDSNDKKTPIKPQIKNNTNVTSAKFVFEIGVV